MNPRESIYLDLLRGLAALDVVFSHACDLYQLPVTGRWGHQSIMIFFVLSGYLIAHVADTREKNFQTFMVARLARLWSVVVPALVLTVVCDLLARHIGQDPKAVASVPSDYPLIRVTSMLLFLSETWVSIQPLSNGAAWSLCLEFWYYVVFGAWTFFRPGWVRNVLLLGGVLLSGHKGILLSPIWLMGVALQRLPQLRRHPAWLDGVLWAASLGLMGWIVVGRLYEPVIDATQGALPPWLFTQLAQARVFWLDWLFGLLVAIHLLTTRRAAQWLPLEKIAGPVRRLAGISFAIYLFHTPILHLTSTFLPPSAGWLAIAITLTLVAILGPPAEGSKRWWRTSLNRAWRIFFSSHITAV